MHRYRSSSRSIRLPCRPSRPCQLACQYNDRHRCVVARFTPAPCQYSVPPACFKHDTVSSRSVRSVSGATQTHRNDSLRYEYIHTEYICAVMRVRTHRTARVLQNLFPVYFAAEIARQVQQKQQKKPEERRPADCELMPILTDIMMTPRRPLMKDDTAQQLEAGVTISSSIGSNRLEVRKRGGDEAHFHIMMEPKAVRFCAPAPLGHSEAVTVDLPPDTSVGQALHYMQKIHDVINTNEAIDLQTMIRDTVPPESEIRYLIVAHKVLAHDDDKELRRFGEFVLRYINDECTWQHNRGIGTLKAIASMRNQDVASQGQAGTQPPSCDVATSRPPLDADTDTDTPGGQMQAATEPTSEEAAPLLEVTNTLLPQRNKRKRSPSKRRRTRTKKYSQFLEG